MKPVFDFPIIITVIPRDVSLVDLLLSQLPSCHLNGLSWFFVLVGLCIQSLLLLLLLLLLAASPVTDSRLFEGTQCLHFQASRCSSTSSSSFLLSPPRENEGSVFFRNAGRPLLSDVVS